MDQPHTDENIGMIKDSGAFVAPCVVLNASMTGITGGELADAGGELPAGTDVCLPLPFPGGLTHGAGPPRAGVPGPVRAGLTPPRARSHRLATA